MRSLFPGFPTIPGFLAGMGFFAVLGENAAGEEALEGPPPPAQVGHPSFLSPHFNPIVLHHGFLFVVNTPADTVDLIDTGTQKVISQIPVGIDPVSLAVRPDGLEIWVGNHISDSVSVIDTNPMSPSYLHVIATIQDIDLETRSTRFDEPVGIAFASNEKAYVALSSENKIAVVDVASRRVANYLDIPAQDPRAIEVRHGKLYVLPFESHNQTQLSGGSRIDEDLVTFDAYKHSIANNNVLSLGHVVDIIKHPDVPDRDLFVFDTRDDQLLETVETLGTLLYGLCIDSKGTVFIAQTDARNHINGRAGTKKHGLAELQNRPFLNQITRVDFEEDKAVKRTFFNLEPLPSEQIVPNHPLATPFAIKISPDDRLIVATAASSDKVFTVDPVTGKPLGYIEVGSVPRGLALESDRKGAVTKAWILNAVSNKISLVDLLNPKRPSLVASIPLEDPTPGPFKRGRMTFNTAFASSSETFSCASCHPDGHVDHLLWVLDTPVVTGGDQIQPRSTMPVRGLRDTAPFHWDGIPGDPYGGNNSANVHGSSPPNVANDDPIYAIRALIDEALDSTMALHDDTVGNGDLLDRNERYYMSHFLLGIPYPPAQRRAYTNVLSNEAEDGFELFHLKGNHEGKPQPNVCGDCHRMPFWVSTNTPGSGMDAPTWRGAYDRFLILPQGRLNVIDFDFFRDIADKGTPEKDLWRFSWLGKARFDHVWNMVLEGSTGYSGAFGRQVTLNQSTCDAYLTRDLLPALESSAREGAIVLQVDALFLEEEIGTTLQFHEDRYIEVDGERRSYSREELVDFARKGAFIGTFTGRHGADEGFVNPQPALWTLSPIHAQSGRQIFPTLTPGQKSMTLNGRHILDGAHVIVNGRRVRASITRGEEEEITITLEELPPPGLQFVQIQNPGGLFSNDFIFHVTVEEKSTVASSHTQSISHPKDR